MSTELVRYDNPLDAPEAPRGWGYAQHERPPRLVQLQIIQENYIKQLDDSIKMVESLIQTNHGEMYSATGVRRHIDNGNYLLSSTYYAKVLHEHLHMLVATRMNVVMQDLEKLVSSGAKDD